MNTLSAADCKSKRDKHEGSMWFETFQALTDIINEMINK